MPKNTYTDLPPSLGPTALPPHITHVRLIHKPKLNSLRYVIETILTLAIWAGLLYLMVLYIATDPVNPETDWRRLLEHFLFNIGVIGLLYVALLATNLVLMSVWAFINKRRAMKQPAPASAKELEHRRMLRTFEVSRTMFDKFNQSNVVTIFHDENGKIEAIHTGCHIPENGLTPEFPPETFIATSWNSELDWPDSEIELEAVANDWRRR